MARSSYGRVDKGIWLSLLAILPLVSATSNIQVNPDRNFFVDAQGRERFFHGVNAVYKQPPYHPSTAEWSATESLNAQDAKQLSDWGFNVVRLGVMWSGVEPVQGEYNMTYLDEISKIVGYLGDENIYTILDMHQDVLARDFCGNGIPSWAAQIASNESHAFPLPAHFPFKLDEDSLPSLDNCLDHDFITYYFSGAVSKAFQSLYDNKYGLLDAFTAYWKLVAQTFKDEEFVLGYEIINEPWAGDIYSDPRRIFTAESNALVPFYNTVHDAIRSVDDDKIVFYEPLTYDVWPVGFDSIPVGGEEYASKSAMSYHIYCPLAGGNTTPMELKVACQVIDWDFFHQRVHDIKRIGGGGIMTEWGSLSNTGLDLAEMNHVLRLADDYLQSHIYWQYKDYHDITCTGDGGISLYPEGEIQDDKVKILARTYAEAVAGQTKKMKFHEKINWFFLNYVPSASEDDEARTTVVRVDREHWYTRGVEVDVDWGEGREEGKVECSEDGREIRISHEDATGDDEIKVKITPCRKLIKHMCTC